MKENSVLIHKLKKPAKMKGLLCLLAICVVGIFAQDVVRVPLYKHKPSTEDRVQWANELRARQEGRLPPKKYSI